MLQNRNGFSGSGCRNPNRQPIVRRPNLVILATPRPMTALSDLTPGDFVEVTISSDPAEARRVQEEVVKLLKASRFTDHEVFGVRLALEEAMVNAIKHGNQLDCSKKVHICYRLLPDRFEIR